jgi:hypothetical protein
MTKLQLRIIAAGLLEANMSGLSAASAGLLQDACE